MKYCPECQVEYSDDQAICSQDATPLFARGMPGRSEQLSDPFIGRTIAEKYCIERLIGRGGMGAVYEGRHLLLERNVAIKVLHKNMSSDERAAARFIREAKASAKIEHPNAVTIHDFGVLLDGSAYLIMEFIRGLSLRQLITNYSRLELEPSINIVIQICSVVEAAHHQGIIHRDLKPENVMLKDSADGSMLVKVVDFGLAKLVSGGDGSAHLTQTGEVLGTPHYMAPEFYEGEQVDKRADIYAIGVILYEMLTGEVPFSGTVQSIIGGHLFKDPKPLFETNPSVHPQVNEVVQWALRKKREERIGSAIELAQKLKAALKTFQKDSGQLPAKGSSKLGVGPTAAPAVAPALAPKLDTPPREPQRANLSKSPTEISPPEFNEQGLRAGLSRGRTDELDEEGSSTQGLEQAEAKDSAELRKRGTQNVAYNTVSMPAQEISPATEPAPGQTGHWKDGKAYDTQRVERPSSEIEQEETETFMEIIASMKRELAIGSVIVTLLAIALVAFIIYRSQQSTIRVKPLSDVPAQTSSSLPASNPGP